MQSRTEQEDHLLENLNPAQRLAVTAPPEHILVVAGAGSGKTRALTHRIAYLISHFHHSPYNILAVTFTNKAATEMRARIAVIQGTPPTGMWVGTFHGLSNVLLRKHWQAADLPETFQILDNEDQYRLVRRVLKTLNLDEAKWPPRQAQNFINRNKEEGVRASALQNERESAYSATMNQIYALYENLCRRSGLVDFAELLLRAVELLKNNQDIRHHYQQRFQHILIDEFQDTNIIQYEWIKLFAGNQNYIMAVGDDDQSIYSWRGANREHMQRFKHDFQARIIPFEQNYRSTQIILSAANNVIQQNEDRIIDKKLWTDSPHGHPIVLYSAMNERDEAHYIISTIQLLHRENYSLSEFAILYRSNAQSRILEECLLEKNIPYRIYGGQKFFERAEIKDALAYLRLIANPYDDAAFERVINTPARGIGHVTLNNIREQARGANQSLWEATQMLLSQQRLSTRAAHSLQQFCRFIQTMQQETAGFDVGELTDHVIRRSGLIEHYQKDLSEKGLARIENLDELINATKQFRPQLNSLTTPLAEFLSYVALEAGEGQADAHADSVNLMTLHAAKGLEYPIIFICGLEEGLFPHKMSSHHQQLLEEERRLFYVGITRAMQRLFLSYAESRNIHGVETTSCQSRFVPEISPHLLERIRPTAKIMRSDAHLRPQNWQTTIVKKATTTPTSGLHIGQQVKHPKFGLGSILNFEGEGPQLRVQIRFYQQGTKWLVAQMAKLEPA